LAGFAAQAADPRGIGSQFPNLRLVDPGGEIRALSTFRPQPVLLVVWAHWCAPCRAEMPSLVALDQTWAKPRGARILLLSLQPAEAAKDIALARTIAPSLPALHTPEPLTAAEWHALFGTENLSAFSIPKAVLLDGDGRVRFLNDNARDWATAGPLLDHWLSRQP
jgi:thiol-disulfide isomerase/thioredoxin